MVGQVSGGKARPKERKWLPELDSNQQPSGCRTQVEIGLTDANYSSISFNTLRFNTSSLLYSSSVARASVSK